MLMPGLYMPMASIRRLPAQVEKAIAVGIESAQIFNHAGHIAQKVNKSAEAAKYFQLSLRSNPSSEFALDARKSVGSDTFAHEEDKKVSQVKRVSDSSADSDTK